MTAGREARLSELFVELADTLTDDFDLVEFLTHLVGEFVDLLPPDHAGVILVDGKGVLHVMASSTERMKVLELFEIQNDDGPCLDAHHTGEALINVELAGADERWPRFAREARNHGFSLVHAVPMRLRDHVVGVVNLFGMTKEPLTLEDARIAQALADIATIGILQERAVRDARVLAEQLQSALTTRIVIEQAKGVLAEQADLDMSDAFELLRGHARSNNLRLSDVAREVVTGTLSVSALRQPS